MADELKKEYCALDGGPSFALGKGTFLLTIDDCLSKSGIPFLSAFSASAYLQTGMMPKDLKWCAFQNKPPLAVLLVRGIQAGRSIMATR